jgi:RNA polymerase sigma factor (sigma-70 family)
MLAARPSIAAAGQIEATKRPLSSGIVSDMERTTAPVSVTALLEQARWMESLAACLLQRQQRRDDADDVVQETWTAAIRHPPDPGRPARPWLAEVMRNVVRMRSRAFVRRQEHERAAGQALDRQESTPQDLVERAQLHRLLVDLVMALDEPYRGTVLLRFFEACTPLEISRRQGVPAGTVRWRLNEALRRLRAALDGAHAGDRERWRALLVPLAGTPAPAPSARGATGAGVHPFVLTAGLLAAGAAGWGLWHLWPARHPVATTSQLSSDRNSTPSEENKMPKSANVARATALALAIPALVAAAAEKTAAPLTVEEGMALCTTLFERVYDCREEMADAYVVKASASERKALRRQALAEVVKDGADQNQCVRESVEKRLKDFPPKRVQEVRDCMQAADCKAFATCIIPVLRRDRKPHDWERR